jgi:nicotinate-nucleotide pyrophosphorylase (carboxylating)
MEDLNALSLPKLFATLTADGSLTRLIDAALAEDLGAAGDITSESIIKVGQPTKARLQSRQRGTIAGLATIGSLICNRSIQVTIHAADGQRCDADEPLATLRGDLREVLGIERVWLNLVGRLSGIATLTRQYVDLVAGTKAAICDTRKTTPGMRNLEKYAVRCGGGTLHRLGLFDAALYKDNHLAAIEPTRLADRLREAIQRVRAKDNLRFVEVEVDSLDQLTQVLKLEGLVDYVLLDNMKPSQLAHAVSMRDASRSAMKLEASGGVSLATVRAIAESGVDRISVGALTHSVACLDVGLDIDA